MQYAGDELLVALGGFGAIGETVARRLDEGIPGLKLAAVAARNANSAHRRLATFQHPVPVIPLGALANHADVVVECAPAAVFTEVAEATVRAGRVFVPVTVGALLGCPELVDLARETGARIMVPTGALVGLDAVRAAAEGEIHSVTLETRKPPRSLAGAPYLREHRISLESLDAPLKVFVGNARVGATGFPANVNVCAALSLAGIGPERTQLELWADPDIARNIHRVRVESDSARFEMTIENIPSDENPSTGRITALSVLATLRALVSSLKIGT